MRRRTVPRLRCLAPIAALALSVSPAAAQVTTDMSNWHPTTRSVFLGCESIGSPNGYQDGSLPYSAGDCLHAIVDMGFNTETGRRGAHLTWWRTDGVPETGGGEVSSGVYGFSADPLDLSSTAPDQWIFGATASLGVVNPPLAPAHFGYSDYLTPDSRPLSVYYERVFFHGCVRPETGCTDLRGGTLDLVSFATLPEPATLALTAGGLLALAGVARRRISPHLSIGAPHGG